MRGKVLIRSGIDGRIGGLCCGLYILLSLPLAG